jgi:hypothetical protein
MPVVVAAALVVSDEQSAMNPAMSEPATTATSTIVDVAMPSGIAPVQVRRRAGAANVV